MPVLQPAQRSESCWVQLTHLWNRYGNLLSFEIDVWGRLRRATEAARADLLASDHFRKAVITTLVSDVASAYFNLLELDMELAIARRTLQLREDSLTIIRNRERGGLGTLLEVRQGEQWCTRPHK